MPPTKPAPPELPAPPLAGHALEFRIDEVMVINALLHQQFAVEFETKDPQVFYGMGAARPDQNIIHYRRRPWPGLPRPARRPPA